jgi:hypothetical protein
MAASELRPQPLALRPQVSEEMSKLASQRSHLAAALDAKRGPLTQVS